MIVALRIFIVTSSVIAVLGGLCLTALVWVYSQYFGQCVKLPNGSELSYEAFVDFGKIYLQPDAVLRDPEGAIIAKEIWPIRVTDVATLGTAWPEPNNSKSNFSFVWTAETGLVKEDENPSLYAELLSTIDLEADSFGAPVDTDVNTLWMFKRLSEDAQYVGRSCATRYVTF